MQGGVAGEWAADLLVDGKVIVESKVAVEHNAEDERQVSNRLLATEIEVGLGIDLGREPVGFKRFVY